MAEIGAEVSIGVAKIFDEGVDNGGSNDGNDVLEVRGIIGSIGGIGGRSRISRLVLMMELRIGRFKGSAVVFRAPVEDCLE